MKKSISLLVIIIVGVNLSAQRFHSVPYYNWSNPISFQLSPSPLITGYGFLSDSLSKAHNNGAFYEYNGEYYPINSWADYYLWYVNRFWYKFSDPMLYEYYYYAEDDYGMASYICGQNYLAYRYPSRIAITFPGRTVWVNKLSVEIIERKNRRWAKRGIQNSHNIKSNRRYANARNYRIKNNNRARNINMHSSNQIVRNNSSRTGKTDRNNYENSRYNRGSSLNKTNNSNIRTTNNNQSRSRSTRNSSINRTSNRNSRVNSSGNARSTKLSNTRSTKSSTQTRTSRNSSRAR